MEQKFKQRLETNCDMSDLPNSITPTFNYRGAPLRPEKRAMMKGGIAQSSDWLRMMHGPGKDVLISG